MSAGVNKRDCLGDLNLKPRRSAEAVRLLQKRVVISGLKCLASSVVESYGSFTSTVSDESEQLASAPGVEHRPCGGAQGRA